MSVAVGGFVMNLAYFVPYGLDRGDRRGVSLGRVRVGAW